uniref:Holin n=1 Tax=viral metagenome TaxID=1070528 RepID=A0A6M3IPG4_9ZZZZ
MEDKKWYKSKTLWMNGIAAVAIVYQMVTGSQFASAEEQAGIIVVINLVLRLITKSGLTA